MARYYAPTKISENIRETPEGFLLCLNVPIARTGWQEYGEGETPLEVGDDGTVKIYRAPEEVFRPATIASYEGKAVTIRHPQEFVSKDNWNFLAKGHLQNVRKSGEKDEDGEESLLADVLVTDATAVGLVKNGLREVSCGYEAEYKQTGRGKGIQTNIVGNHLALVEEGRAGPTYAINDEKGKATMSATLIERLKKKLGAKVVDEAMAEEKPESKDEGGKGYDELIKMVKDLGEKVDAMKPAAKDEEKPAKKEEKPAKDEEEKPAKEEPAKDEEGGELAERVKALEAAVAKLLEKMGSEAGDEESEESEDEESEESEDEDGVVESKKTGDAAYAEILAPGKKLSGKTLRVEALKAAYATTDGKALIKVLNGGKEPTFDAATADRLFIPAGELLKAKRGTGLEKTKDATKFEIGDSKVETITPEKLNEMNAQHWAKVKGN